MNSCKLYVLDVKQFIVVSCITVLAVHWTELVNYTAGGGGGAASRFRLDCEPGWWRS